MRHTETYFGLENHNGKITADNGKTYLPKYQEMSITKFEELVADIEDWLEKELTEEEVEDLKEILK